jgi:hypothetical protein
VPKATPQKKCAQSHGMTRDYKNTGGIRSGFFALNQGKKRESMKKRMH